ncbi:hypothetical protein HELRODRAFT_98540 [Helobdella robusta]|uniref:GB1/RHD3-type G domain-containing protein n=1 Tax=Helobdella robusta TaxID=6412 RepID=T1G9N5_HELRO|nr:hypothetical protein HELRODRAFT_98540 [Helobdella robusta]ESO07142.1 hypothetical protein HELRODRAFT_98540 [Helobdella robusta]
MVVSVAGAYRKGKSFLLNFFLRYLNSDGKENWMGEPNDPLIGFQWRGGSERLTSGILIWSEPYIIRNNKGDEVCVLLMDTQGAFDSQSTVKDCATVFALSTMLSSVQVFNITGNIQEDDLQHLELFTEYGRLALQTYEDKPFQTLHFLVRDWQYPYQHPYGAKGGSEILAKRLMINPKQHNELQNLRRHLQECFKVITCYLMPHPGLKVATERDFIGKLSDIDDEFKVQVKSFTESIFQSEHVVIKNINGSDITGKELIEYFKAYLKVYQGSDLPEPKSMLEATSEANNLAAVATAKDFYNKEMEKVCGGDKQYMKMEQLKQEHERWFFAAIKMFKDTRKMGGADFCAVYEKRLEKDLLEMYDAYLKNNEAKNVASALQTPLVLVLLAVVVYILSGVFGLLGAESIVRLFNMGLGLAVLLLVAWSYSRYTGQFRVVGEYLDAGSKFVCEHAMKKVPAESVTNLAINAAKGAMTTDKKRN